MHIQSSVVMRRLGPQIPPREVRILLVEDCRSDVYLFERMLEGVSVNCLYRITNVPRLIDAFSTIDQEKFDLIMLDLNLVDIDGVASVAALRAEVPHIPIIVYSGMDDANMKEKALMCGAKHYLVKGRESGYGLKHLIDRAII